VGLRKDGKLLGELAVQLMDSVSLDHLQFGSPVTLFPVVSLETVEPTLSFLVGTVWSISSKDLSKVILPSVIPAGAFFI
jgi:hypothetical protein